MNNNWEATYFDFTQERLIEIAEKAKECGVELFVLDDGWFGQRCHERAGLGDWVANPERLAEGIEGLAEKIENLGMKFGLWFEPEMVNKDSELYSGRYLCNDGEDIGRRESILCEMGYEPEHYGMLLQRACGGPSGGGVP